MSQLFSPDLPKTSTGQSPRPPKSRRDRAPVVQRIAGWSARYRKTAVLGWLALVAVIFLGGQGLGIKSVPFYDAGQSGQAEQTLHRLGVTAPAVENVLIQARGPGGAFAADPQMQEAARQVVAVLDRLPHAAAGIRSPLGGGSALVSAGGRSALVTFQVPGLARSQVTAVAPALRAVAALQASHPGLLIAEAGGASENRALSAVPDSGFRRTEATSVPITLVLLLVVFGALVAAGIPLLLAVTSVMTALSLLTVVSRWLPVSASTSEVVLIIGMAVGVDYSLFYLRREREERAKGAAPGEALRTAAATSGRAIAVSGLTVMAALAGLFLTRFDAFTGIAFGTIAVVGVAVAGSLTLLPALLSWLGPRSDRGLIPVLGRRRTAARPSRVWAAVSRHVVRRPVLWGGAAAIALLALAVPALGMRLGSPAVDLPAGSPVLQTIDKIQQAFPQTPSPAQVVVTGTDLTGPAIREAIATLNARASAAGPRGPIREPITATPAAGGRALLIDVPIAGNGTSSVSGDALLSLRTQLLPATLGKVSGISYAVAGVTAENYDDTAAVDAGAPLVFAFVAVLAFLLLTAAKTSGAPASTAAVSS